MVTNSKKQFLLGFLTFLLTVGVLEGVSWIGLYILESAQGISYHPTLSKNLSGRHERALKKFIHDGYKQVEFSSTLGWTNKPGSNVKDEAYVINSQGIRATREYTIENPDNKIRIATFGDSFTFGQDVRNEDTWQENLVRQNDSYELLNFGLGGHGTDQALLRYRHEGVTYSPDVVVIGFMSENINRIVNVYRPFYVKQTGIPLTKPRFVLSDNSLELVPNPHQSLEQYSELLDDPESILPHLGQHDYFYTLRYSSNPLDIFHTVRLLKLVKHELLTEKIYTRERQYNEDSEAYRLLQKIIEQFYQEALSNGSIPIVMIYQEFGDIDAMRKKRNKKYTPLLTWLKSLKYNHVDLMDAFLEFRKSGVEESFFADGLGHYSATGNYFVARHMDAYLKSLGIISTESANQ